MNEIATLIRDVPDYPTPGILFRDITPLLLDPRGLRTVTDRFAEAFSGRGIDRVAAIESRGFILGAPLAMALGCGFVPIRKLGKLPRETLAREYALEYGTNQIEVHLDAIDPGSRVLIVDDVLATGGTARATIDLIEELGGEVVAVAFLLELDQLGGRELLGRHEIVSLLHM